MGRLYGQPTRLLLNYDAVFLGELLTTLKPTVLPYATPYLSHNCLALPNTGQMPLALQYAATANVLLAEFKLHDHIADSRSVKAKITLHALSGAFDKVHRQLKIWHFPLERVQRLLASQSEREQEVSPQLLHVMEPTATSTRIVFEHGAHLVSTDATVAQQVATIGESFGRIAYLTDAIHDQVIDAQTGDFNALTATHTSLPTARDYLKTWQTQMIESIYKLPIETEQKMLFANRLQANLTPYLTGTILTMASTKKPDEEKDKNPEGCEEVGKGCCDCCNCCSDGFYCCNILSQCHSCHCH
jgi:hypothetical protein